jgi:WD40 repeat protein
MLVWDKIQQEYLDLIKNEWEYIKDELLGVDASNDDFYLYIAVSKHDGSVKISDITGSQFWRCENNEQFSCAAIIVSCETTKDDLLEVDIVDYSGIYCFLENKQVK